MARFKRSGSVLASVLAVSASLACAAESSTVSSAEPVAADADLSFLNVEHDDGDQPVELQTAIVKYVPTDDALDAEVYLVGAVHVGDKPYYDALNEEFKQYDVLLYELVAPEGTRIPRGTTASSRHPVGALQGAMKAMLNLDHQLECVDYEAKNFVHADMSPDDFAESMKQRNESFIKLYFRLLGASLAMQSKTAASGRNSDVDLLLALFRDDPSLALKRIMADQFQEMEWMMGAFEGEEGSTLISERNKVALAKLREQLDAKQKKIGVFYGAGHLDDMDERLRNEFDMRPVEIRWLTAWDMHSPDESR